MEEDGNFTWDKTPQRVRGHILDGLMNHARLAIMQKERLFKYIKHIKTFGERKRALQGCDEQLVIVGHYLDAFSCFDDRIKNLYDDVSQLYYCDPKLDDDVKASVEIIGAMVA
jgi:hypothetical protein